MSAESWPIRRFRAEDVLRMVEVGILEDGDRVELLDGVLVEMSPQGPLHAAVATALARRLSAAYGEVAHVRDAKPLLAGEHSLPEPDLAVVAGSPASYLARHPSGDEALLVVELAWSSQERDAAKAEIYAAAGVPEYWLVDLETARITRHRDPSPDDGYRNLTEQAATASLPVPGTDTAIVLASLMTPT